MAEQYYVFIRCPACIAEKKKVGPPSQWYHSNCGGKLKIGDDAYYQCEKCNHRSHVKDWRYSCQYHSDHRPTSSNHFANAVSIYGEAASSGGAKWLIRLLQNLGEDW